MMFWDGKYVLVTGGAGFLGQVMVDRLKILGAKVFVPRKAEFDLREPHQVKELFRVATPSIVIHAAAHGGGIGYMQQHPGEVFYDNIIMNPLMIQGACEYGIERFVGVGSVCSYPKFLSVPFREEDLWNGYPEETNGAYGLAKKMMGVQLEAYNKQYEFQGVTLLLANIFGPRDNFNLSDSHVIPALIRRFGEAKKNGESAVILWGSGEISREFLYVEDAAQGIILAAEHANKIETLNLGTGIEVLIKDLASLIQELTGYKGSIIWDRSMPDGQPRRCLEVDKAKKVLGFQAKTELKEGLKKTIDWYRQTVGNTTSSIRV